jgi:glycosyltransferase involved in cell wall biosynthesis
MKRILIATGVFAPDIGGPASYARNLATRLASQDVQVTVLAYSSVASFEADKDLPFRIVRVWKKIPWGLRHAIFFMRAFFIARHADGILTLNATTSGFTTAVAARLAGKPLVVKIVGDYAWEVAIQTGRTFLMINDFQKSQKTGRVRRLDAMQKWVCRKAAAVIVPSEYLAGLVTGWGIDPSKIHVIYNGVDLPKVSMSKEEARRAIGIAGTIIISCGRLVPWKGFRMLIKVMPQLLQVNQFFRLVIVGDGPDMAMLQSVVRNLGLERKVYIVGRKNPQELAVYLAAADMFVLNTGYEGFSHQILEAMTAGVPVITTNVGGNREIITQGENGFLVRYNDEFNLVEAMKTLLRQQDVREYMIANAKHTVAAFSAERMFQQTQTLLNETFLR